MGSGQDGKQETSRDKRLEFEPEKMDLKGSRGGQQRWRISHGLLSH